MKWTVAGAGALLSLSGVYALISGGSIIQVERGWATFIAGAVLLGAGFIVLGLAALIARIDQFWARHLEILSKPDVAWPQDQQDFGQPDYAVQPYAKPDFASQAFRPEFPVAAALNARQQDVPPPPREVAVEPLPTLESVNAQAEDERPAALREFKFVFPPPDAPLETQAEVPVAPPAPAPQPVEPSVSAGRKGLNWLRRNKEPAVAPEPAPELMPEPAPAVEQPAAPEPDESETLAGAHFDDQSAQEVVVDEQSEPVAEATPEPDAAPEPEPAPAPAVTPDPFTDDWLERALAGDEPREKAPRFTPPSMRRAAASEPKMPEAVFEAPAAPEPAPEPEPTPEPAPVPAEPVLSAPPPVEIGRYRANDVAYVMFSDGSITAETPTGGSYRFSSLVELRAFIERGGV